MPLPRFIHGAASVGVALLVALIQTACQNSGIDSSNQPPGVPVAAAVNGSPGAAATGTSLSPTLRWQADDPDGQSLTFDLFFGPSPLPPIVAEGLGNAEYRLDSLEYATTYYWRVLACDPSGLCTSSPRWQFTTIASQDIQVYTDPAMPIVAKVGGEFGIDLRANLSEHRIWSWIEPVDRSIVDVLDQTFRSDEGATHQVWRLRAVAVGRTTLSLALRQEGAMSPLDVAHFELIVF